MKIVCVVIVLHLEYMKGKTYPLDLLKDKFSAEGHDFDLFQSNQLDQINFESYDLCIIPNYKPDIKINHPIPILTFKTAFNLENFSIRRTDFLKNTYYGIPSDYYLDIGHNNSKKFVPSKSKIIKMPIFSAYQVPPLNSDKLDTIEKFKKKYSIPLDRKLMILVGGRVDKIVDYSKKDSLNSDPILSKLLHSGRWILKNFRSMIKLLIEKGYQPLIRFHCREYRYQTAPEQMDYRKTINNLCTIIDDDDGYWAYKYSDFAISYFTSTCYELYLYNLPTLEIGSGMYLYRWGFQDLSPKSKKYYQKYQDSLLFGKVIDSKNISNDNILEFISDVETGCYKIEDFEYLNDHPLYADTYYNSVDNMYSLIINFYQQHIWKH